MRVHPSLLISTHDLTKRSTTCASIFSIDKIFQLTTSRRGRLPRFRDKPNAVEFQLTTSRRGRRREPQSYLTDFLFQLTTSRRGRLRRSHSSWGIRKISTHDLTKRSTYTVQDWCFSEIISTHDLTKRSTSRFDFSFAGGIFQLTTSRRGRRKNLLVSNKLVTFQLTTSRRGRPRFLLDNLTWICISTHDLTKRSTAWQSLCLDYRRYFNSRPHEEVDNFLNIYIIIYHISTHDLTKRSTAPETRSEVIRENFNSRPHEEVDNSPDRRLISPSLFQLTTSRRGRLHRIFLEKGLTYFNSRPHAEVDACRLLHTCSTENFNSRPHEEVDQERRYNNEDNIYFNSRPHEEVDGFTYAVTLDIDIFQLTTSRRGRLHRK